MGMVVRTNTMALNAYRQLGMNNSAVAKSLEKLSSGFRINRAGDDAAGLAISEKMKAQITGLETASANAQDGISLIQTAEGNLTEVHSMLNRMVELAAKSANGTYQNEVDREALQAEMDQLLDEIDRISKSANFNGIKLLDGSLDSSTTAADAAAEAAKNVKPVYKDPLSTDEVIGKILPESTTNAITDVGNKTILETDFANTGSAGFKVSLNGVSHVMTGTDTDKITINVNGVNINLTEAQIKTALGDNTLKAGDKISSEQLATAFAKTMDTTTTKWEDAANNGNKYTVEAKGESLVFTAVDNLDTNPNRHFDVTITGVAKGTPVDAKAASITTKAMNAGGAVTKDEKIELTVSYKDATGVAQTKDISYTVADGDVIGDVATGLINAMNEDEDLKALFTASGSTAGITLTANEAGVSKVELTDITVKTAGATTNISFATGAATIVKGENAYTPGTDGYLNYGTEHVIMAGKPAVDQLASTTLTLTEDDLQDGTKITLGDQEYTIAIGEDSKYKDVEGAVYVEGLKADDTDFLEKISSKLSEVAADNKTFTVSHQGTGGQIGLKQLAEAKDSTDMSTMKNLASYIGISQVDVDATAKVQEEADKAAADAAAKVGKALTLQIGDTADDFNKMKVNIADMSSEGLKLAELRENGIMTEENASDAIDKIKTAINTVSTARADMGALQNRLEHTINNLDVAVENLSAANSRIRDTDMAKEMMNYTKMNVLVQSAQAMLAQANQQPQSVLQLLQ